MKAYWYSPSPDLDIGNVGDQLTPVIIEYLTGVRPGFVRQTTMGKLLAVGSLVEFTEIGDTIWGSGLIERRKINKYKDVTILAVRGKLTAECMRQSGYNVPEVYGDPALLMPELFSPHEPIRHDLAVIPHYVEREAFSLNYPGVYSIDVCSNYKSFIRQLVGCQKIITSSLHAYILANAYGVQAEYLQLTSKIIGGYFKYEDYITGRGDIPDTCKKLKEVFFNHFG